MKDMGDRLLRFVNDASLVEKAVLACRDDDLWQKMLERERAEKDKLRLTEQHWPAVARFVDSSTRCARPCRRNPHYARGVATAMAFAGPKRVTRLMRIAMCAECLSAQSLTDETSAVRW
jgi:hypothetical protein